MHYCKGQRLQLLRALLSYNCIIICIHIASKAAQHCCTLMYYFVFYSSAQFTNPKQFQIENKNMTRPITHVKSLAEQKILSYRRNVSVCNKSCSTPLDYHLYALNMEFLALHTLSFADLFSNLFLFASEQNFHLTRNEIIHVAQTT